MANIGILIFEDDEASQSALRQMLDSEGWRVQVVPKLAHALAELSTGEWSLVIASVAMTGLTGPLYSILKDLALAPAMEGGKFRARVLFVVPETSAGEVRTTLEKEHLPYVLRPFQFQDVIERVSDLLMETTALSVPIRQVQHNFGAANQKQQGARDLHQMGVRQTKRDTGMFASRGEYSMTEEEIAEYEKSEQSEQERKKKKKDPFRN